MKSKALARAFLASSIALAAASCGPPQDDESAVGTAEQSLSSDPRLDELQAHPPHRVHGNATAAPTGLSPAGIRAVYGLPSSGGTGTIAIIDAYDAPTIESDLAVFSSQYGLPVCTTANGCFEKHRMGPRISSDSGWALETSLDVEWAHAIAPDARILLVEARSNSLTNLLAAVDYARSRADVVAISMSWGSSEFSSEASYDAYFTSAYGAAFFASSGDNGTGASWPAASPNVVAVGGTSLAFNPDGSLASETAWSGSGGGISAYQPLPSWQAALGLAYAGRAIPDVSYDADPASGFSVYDSTRYQGQKGWFRVGGTSAGAPQWAAIQALGLTCSNAHFYQDAAGPSASTYFRDVTSGTNGACGANCTAGAGYDLVTGVGSPLTTGF
ncbi:MAG TPA: S53 family peptidase [Candidatus Binatia bacterium]|jgi:subtilase family serine protease|nr:S53 family peptidase [Candidatus Binatia bacterium]